VPSGKPGGTIASKLVSDAASPSSSSRLAGPLSSTLNPLSLDLKFLPKMVIITSFSLLVSASTLSGTTLLITGTIATGVCVEVGRLGLVAVGVAVSVDDGGIKGR